MIWIDKARAWMADAIRPRASDNRITDPGDLEDVLRSVLGGGTSESGAMVSTDAAMRQAAVWACVMVIAQSIAYLPLPLYRTNGRQRESARNSPLWSLLHDRPNEWQTAFEWRETAQIDLLLRGNTYAQKVFDGSGRVIELIRIAPDRVEVEQDERTLEVRYLVKQPEGVRVPLLRSEVLHVRGPSRDGVTGMNPIQVHRETFGDAISLRSHGSRFFSNGAKPLGLLKQPAGAAMKPEARKALIEDFTRMHSGNENAYRVGMLPSGIEYEAVKISMEDAQYIESKKFSRSEIAGIFRVPPHKIGDLEKATFSNIEHQALEFVTDTILPWTARWEQAIHRDLLDSDRNRYVKFTVDALLRGDAKSRAEALQMQRRNGVINANEWRALEDMNPRTDAGGDAYIIEANMRPDDGSDPTQTTESTNGPDPTTGE